MREEFINFETAKLAKEKGFEFKVTWNYILGFKNNIERDKYLPTQSLLQKWLREVHNIYVSSFPYQDYSDNWKPIDLMYYYSIIDLNKFIKQDINNGTIGELGSDINFKTYEEALEAGLQEALKKI